MKSTQNRFFVVLKNVEQWIGSGIASLILEPTLRALAMHLCKRDPQAMLEGFGPLLNRKPNLDNMPFDLPGKDRIDFEHLAGLFASTSLDHGVISMPIRQAADLFGLVRRMKPKKVVEIGRYKGGSTLLIEAAMGGDGEFWSIDIGEKEKRLHDREGS